jgi:hypothetical protein
VNNPSTTQEHINKIIEFRQALYEHGFRRRRDALFEALDALLLAGPVASFAMLSLDPGFKRQWHSLYKGLEKGKLDQVWLTTHLARQVPGIGIEYFSLDGTAWPRPRARTLGDRQYVYHPTQAVNGGSVCVGYPYSLLDWVPRPHSSWSLSVNPHRIPSTATAREVGVQQIQALGKARRSHTEGLDIVAADAKYGNARFLRPLQSQPCGIVVRLRKDRVLYRAPEPPLAKRRGRPPVHGARFAFKEPDTWDTPQETLAFKHPHLGQVKLERWNNLHGQRDADVPFDIVRACIHLERTKPPAPIWLAWQAPPSIPQPLHVTAEVIWHAYCHRWPVEPGTRFRKQCLGWNLPRFQHKETGDRWSWLVALALWLLYLAHPIVQDRPLPWQKPQTSLTPQRVQQSLVTIFEQFGSPVRCPKVRGKPPGWPQGRPRTPKQRFRVVKKPPAQPYTA